MIFKFFVVAFLVFNLSTAAPPPASEYIGCCKDGAGGVRELPVKMNLTVTSNQQCQTLCGNYGYAFAGTQNGNQCWCGYNKCSQGIFLDTFCAKPCSDTTQVCGGISNRNSVYKVPTRYVGCVQDAANARILPYSAYKGSIKNKPDDCIAYCRRVGHYFAGVQNNDCWCGSQLGSLRFVAESQCSSPCSGNSTMTCGGNLRNSMWRV